MKFMMSLDDRMSRSLNRIEELLDLTRDEADELTTMMSVRLHELEPEDPRYEGFATMFVAIAGLVPVINNLRRQTAVALDA